MPGIVDARGYLSSQPPERPVPGALEEIRRRVEAAGRRMLDRAFLPPKSALDIFVKDMGLVRKAAAERGFGTPLSDTAHRLYETGASLGFGREDDSGILRVFEEGVGPSRQT